MHILFFIHSLAGGGAERVTVNLANHWVRKGKTVTILTLAGKDQDAYSLDERICRLSLNMAGNSENPIASIVNNVKRLSALRRALNKAKPDVALGIMSTASCLLALAGSSCGAVRIGTERSFPPMLPLGQIWEMIRRHSYRNLDAVIALTKESAHWIKTRTSARYVPVIFNPIPFPLPVGTPILPPASVLDASKKTLLAVGRLNAEKAFDHLLQAFARLAPDFLDWTLAIVGDGPERETLKALARQLEIEDRIIMPGQVGNVGDWYAASDIYVMTSLFEGFPNVIGEAMAYGLPAVSVDCDTGPRDIITDGVDGYLVPMNDTDALCDKLSQLMADDKLRQKLGARAKEIRDRLSLERIVKQWESLFEECSKK